MLAKFILGFFCFLVLCAAVLVAAFVLRILRRMLTPVPRPQSYKLEDTDELG